MIAEHGEERSPFFAYKNDCVARRICRHRTAGEEPSLKYELVDHP